MDSIHCVDTANKIKGFHGRFCNIIKPVFKLKEKRQAGVMAGELP